MLSVMTDTVPRLEYLLAGAIALFSSVAFALPVQAQDRGTPFGEWRYWGADSWSTRYSPIDQIDADNFGDLEQAWLWRGDNMGPSPDHILRSDSDLCGR